VGRRDTTLDLLLKHPNTTVATYVRRQLKYFKHASETLEKTPEKQLGPLQPYANIQIHATYV
jgi:hypothetical protein